METQSGRIKCPYCSEAISASAKKCRFCGEWLDANEGTGRQNIAPIGKLKANAHPSYGTFTILSLLIPIAGLIVGIVYMTKDNPLDKKVGEHAIVMSIVGVILFFIFLSLI
ncbi:MAG: hypothetical protein WC726_01270 [Parcubacteria group bacterium]|jgi:hypothetical protein